MFDVATLSLGSGPINEDRALHIERGTTQLIFVADGAGGTGGGSAAAELAVTAIRGCRLIPSLVRDPGYWRETVSMLDVFIHREQDAGECTAVVVAINDGRIVGSSVGDSGAWMFTDDGSVELTNAQKRKPLLGSAHATVRPFGPMLYDGTLLVATDGLLKYAAIEHIKQAATTGNAAQAAENLAELVRLPSGELHDDIALVICKPKTL